MKNSFPSFLLTALVLTLCGRFYTTPVSAEAINPVSYEIKISAAIGEPKLTLYGWGPVESKINLTGLAVAETRQSDANGFFIFTNIFLPSKYSELCLQAVDKENRSSHPTCIPPLPANSYSYNVGPVLLSPIISIDQAVLNGKTTPFTPINVYLANQKSSGKISFNPVKTANAYYIPEYQTQSDKEGNFEFNLPNQSRGKWKIFVASETLGYNSPKSNSLTFSVMSPFSLLLRRIISGLMLLKPYLLYIVILLELVILAVIIIKSKTKH
ncbi:MAG: hypothetical protein Q8P91_02745 [bacterium]|nr:hypothetical protein [bacterium]